MTKKPRINARISVSKGGHALGKNKNVKWRQHMEDKCRRCKFMPEDGCQLTVDHINKDKTNNKVENLQTLCANCHNLKSKIELTAPEKLILLNLIPSTST
jgi:5-methylcytosine-specific restriction endonuclease McrA